MAPKTVFDLITESCEENIDTQALAREMLTRIGDKWTMLVVQSLADAPQRFTALLEFIPGISHRMLTVTLRALARDGLVSRTAFAETPPRVEYSLTELGQTLLPAVLTLVGWVRDHRPEVEASRAAYDG